MQRCPLGMVKRPFFIRYPAFYGIVGAANRNGVTAALLAQQGCRAPLDILDGSHSLFDAYLGAPDAGGEAVKGLGEYFSITDVMHKRYPVGSPNQTYLQGLFGLIEKQALRPDDIAEVEVQIPQRGLRRIPTTRHASISALTVCAIAAAHGELDFYRLHDPAGAMDAAARAMQQRVKFVGRADWNDMEAGRHAIVTIRTKLAKRLARALAQLAAKGPFRKKSACWGTVVSWRTAT